MDDNKIIDDVSTEWEKFLCLNYKSSGKFQFSKPSSREYGTQISRSISLRIQNTGPEIISYFLLTISNFRLGASTFPSTKSGISNGLLLISQQPSISA